MSANVSRALRGSSMPLPVRRRIDPQPGDHLFQAERLGDVVVAAERQAGDLVLQGVAGGEEQRGRVDAVGAQPAQHAEAVHAGHHDVEDDRVGPHFTGLVERGGAVGGGVDLEALELQAHREQLDDVGLVVDDEDSGLRDVFWECSHGHRPNVSQLPGNEAAGRLSTSCESHCRSSVAPAVADSWTHTLRP